LKWIITPSYRVSCSWAKDKPCPRAQQVMTTWKMNLKLYTVVFWSRNSSVGTNCWIPLKDKRLLCIPKIPDQLPTQWVPWALSLEVKRPGREAHHSLSSGAEVTNNGAKTPLALTCSLFWKNRRRLMRPPCILYVYKLSIFFSFYKRAVTNNRKLGYYIPQYLPPDVWYTLCSSAPDCLPAVCSKYLRSDLDGFLSCKYDAILSLRANIRCT
jgi:hypothetical protein